VDFGTPPSLERCPGEHPDSGTRVHHHSWWFDDEGGCQLNHLTNDGWRGEEGTQDASTSLRQDRAVQLR
jgi:hypothetical protein